MRIKSIIMENFMGFSGKKSINLGDDVIVALVAANGSGKTSLLQALRYGLTGEEPAKDIVNAAADTCSVTLELLDDEGDITTVTRIKSRQCGNKFQINGKTSTLKALNDQIERLAGARLESLKIMSSREVVEALTPTEFGKFLLSYVNKQMTLEDISSTVALTDDAKAILESMVPEAGISVKGIEKLHDVCFDRRRAQKNLLQTKKGVLAGMMPTGGFVPYEGKPMNELEEELKVIHEADAKRKNYASQKAAHDAAVNAYNNEVKAFNQAVESAKKYNANLQSIMIEIEANKASEPDYGLRDKLNNEIRDLKSSLKNLTEAKISQEMSVKQMRSLLDAIESNVCPIHKDIICKTDKSAYKTSTANAISDAEAGIKKLEAEIKGVEKKIALNEQKVVEFGENESKWKILQNTLRQKAQLEKSRPIIPERPVKPTLEEVKEPDSAEFGSLRSEREVMTDIQRLNAEADNKKKQEECEKIKEEITALEKEIAALDMLVSVSSDKGEIKNALISLFVTALETACNEETQKFKKGSCFKFLVNDGVYVFFDPGTGEPLPYQNLSSGEKAYATLSIMHMLNQLTSSRIMFLDEMSVMDAENFAVAIEFVKDVEDDYDHILIAGANHDDTLDILKEESINNIF